MTTGQEWLELEAANALAGIVVLQLPQCCGRPGCKNSDIAPKCIVEGCNKYIHYACYQGTVLQKHGCEPLDNDVPEDEHAQNVVVCTKTCYKKAGKEARKGGASLLWNKDGWKGPDDPMNLLAILLKWLMTPGNYSKYRGKKNLGKTKIQFAEDIAKKSNDAGVRVKHDRDG
jgi:hypothetical protein